MLLVWELHEQLVLELSEQLILSYLSYWYWSSWFWSRRVSPLPEVSELVCLQSDLFVEDPLIQSGVLQAIPTQRLHRKRPAFQPLLSSP